MNKKVKKFITKRIKITPKGKALRRGTGQNHYNAKKSAKKVRDRKNSTELSPAYSKIIKKYI